MKKYTLEAIGMLGMLLTLGAYIMSTFGDVNAAYHWVNLASCVVLGYYTFHKRAWANVGLASAWGVIAVIGLVSVS